MRSANSRLPSLRHRLLQWIVVPILVVVIVDTWSLYRIALESANTAYDRALLASARSIGEQLRIEDGRLVVSVPFVALDVYESAIAGRMYYQVLGFQGEHLSGYEDFPPLRDVPRSRNFPALVRFYDDEFRSEQVRVAALYQPVVSQTTQGLALVMVAETFDSRRAMTNRLLSSMLIRQALFVVFVAAALWWAITRGLRPLEDLRRQLEVRNINDTHLSTASGRWRELAPLVGALNAAWSRLAALIESRKRFLVDASHQLRTPLAALKTHAELIQRRSTDAEQRATAEAISRTADHAARLAGQLVSIARAEYSAANMQRRQVDLSAVVRDVGLELGAQAVQKNVRLEFDLPEAAPLMAGDSFMLHELVANLMHNALRYTPEGGLVQVQLNLRDSAIELLVQDSGPGVPAELHAKLGKRFFTAHPGAGGSGLGLAIVKEIVLAHGADLRFARSPLGGLLVRVSWALPSINLRA